MDERTRDYLRGRFGDHYRRVEVSPPPDAADREWGHIPFTPGPGTTMVRHQSWVDVAGGGSLSDFLAREKPRHAYFSAGRYDLPGAEPMSEKGWNGSDLIFDLDADHLPSVDPEDDSYAERLATCKDALVRLLDFLEDDFGFENLTVVFSGGRGYHVHVRDEGVHELDRADRREIVEYVRGPDLAFDDLVHRETVDGMGMKNPTHKRTLPTAGGWGARVHEHLMALIEDVRELPEDEASERLQAFEGIGEGKAQAVLANAGDNYEELAAGNVDVHPAVVSLSKLLFERARREDGAPIDEPVTTDINRLIRLPGSLHGGSGLRVTPIERDGVEAFDPLVDAVPETFRGHDIRVKVTDGGPVDFGGDSFTIGAGDHSVTEALGVFLMARGRAEKAPE